MCSSSLSVLGFADIAARNRATDGDVARIAIAVSASVARPADAFAARTTGITSGTAAETVEKSLDITTRFVEDRTEPFSTTRIASATRIAEVVTRAAVAIAASAARIAVAGAARIARIASAGPVEQSPLLEERFATAHVAARITVASATGIARVADAVAARSAIAGSARAARIAKARGEEAFERTEGAFSTYRFARIATAVVARIAGDDAVTGTAFGRAAGLAGDQFFQT